MLASFPFRLEIASFQLKQVRFFAKDLFFGSEREIFRLQDRAESPDSMSPHRSGFPSALNDYQAVTERLAQPGVGGHVKEISAIRIPSISIDGTLLAPKHEGGFDLNEILRSSVAKLGSEVLRSAPVMSIIFQIVPALLSNNVLWGSGIATDTTITFAPASPKRKTDIPQLWRRTRSGLPGLSPLRPKGPSDPALGGQAMGHRQIHDRVSLTFPRGLTNE